MFRVIPQSERFDLVREVLVPRWTVSFVQNRRNEWSCLHVKLRSSKEGSTLTKRIYRRGRLGLRNAPLVDRLGEESGIPLTNQAWSRHRILCWQTTLYDSLSSLARKFLLTKSAYSSCQSRAVGHIPNRDLVQQMVFKFEGIRRSRGTRFQGNIRATDVRFHIEVQL